MEQYFLVDTTSGKRELLRPGKNVIGRSATVSSVDGVSFVSLESPSFTISRVQAVVEVASNGDAWISDCNSTNGTFLAISEGSGIRLDPHCFYQLKPGNRVILGDVEMRLETGACSTNEMGDQKGVMPSSALSSLNTSHPTNLSGAHSEILCASNDTRVATTANVTTTIEKPSDAVKSKANGAALQKSHECLSGKCSNDRVESAPYPEGSVFLGRKRIRSSSDITPPSGASKTVSSFLRVHWVCFSGMDGAEKADAQKLAKKLGWQTTDRIVDADILVVGSPVTRTPKFLIAVGRGIPVVTGNFLKDGDTAQLEKYVPALSHGSHTYSAASLRKVIFRECKKPILQGVSFQLGALPRKLRAVAREIILGCGGDIVRAQSTDALSLTEESLDSVYDSVLRGESL
ncbi:hypothetical protein BCY84_20497 [Trypanosoma cruzi cruzi]|uniref:FHA domain-containing protein n=1 Tax=Trypanosoma cruzi TaxID=5693 RepID=A0A2V2VVB1_TRYCR|nr:putative FHA domain containing protein [Trypanosoma cruzi]PBJ69018.1 hypothetical protein BCY84_20497 [Trypanosoma cruzi cruzi]PWV00055.1 hypothetical protein C4B63_7g412 [Trypanosoma cruzi]